MSALTDCPSCGGLLPEGKRCCPHCHCKYPAIKRWKLLAAAALGLGAADCGGDQPGYVEYGPALQHDLSGADFSAAADAGNDAGHDGGPVDGGAD